MRGTLGLFNLVEVLQLLGVNKQSGVLSVVHPQQHEAKIYFQDGRIVHAFNPNQKGVFDHGILVNLLRDERGEFQFYAGRTPPQKTVDQSLDAFLFEVIRMLPPDTAHSTVEHLLPDHIPVVLHPKSLTHLHLPPDDAYLAALINGQRNIAQLSRLERKPGQFDALLKRLIAAGIVDLQDPVQQIAKLALGVSRNLNGVLAAIDQATLNTWERRLGEKVHQVRVRFEDRRELSIPVIGQIGISGQLLFSSEAMLFFGLRAGVPLLAKPDKPN